MSNVKKGFRNSKQQLKTAKGRKIGSSKWLSRHLNDPFVKLSKAEGYRSRAAYKLIAIAEKYPALFKNAKVIFDLGCAPGSWLQVLTNVAKAQIIGADLQDVEPIVGAEIFKGDLEEPDFVNFLQTHIAGAKADVILSDMAAAASGDPETDHLRICNLVEVVLYLATQILAANGAVVAKMLKGREEQELIMQFRKYFDKVERFKPEASYSNSAEFYIVATGFKEKSI